MGHVPIARMRAMSRVYSFGYEILTYLLTHLRLPALPLDIEIVKVASHSLTHLR